MELLEAVNEVVLEAWLIVNVADVVATDTVPISLPKYWVNHTLPSGPTAMSVGSLGKVGIVYSVMLPPGVIMPILPA